MNGAKNNDLMIVYESQPLHDDTTLIWQGISQNAKLKRGHEPGKPFAFFVKNANDRIMGGCSGYLFYGCLYVDLLWVDLSLRNKNMEHD